MLEEGKVQLYTGDGKGKTTAALGLGLRAVGRGLAVRMVQFLKGSETGELISVKRLAPDFQIFRFEKERGFFWTLSEEEKGELKAEIDEAFEFVKELLGTGGCDLLILDEAASAMTNGLIDPSELAAAIRARKGPMEVVLTGRNMPEEITALADLITEMRPVKHYFDDGVMARVGIEE